MAVNPLCTDIQLDDILSPFGVTVRSDDDDSGENRDDDNVDACIEKATTEVLHQLYNGGYENDDIYASTWVKWCCAILAACDLCRRRGNGPPAALAEQETRYREQLQKIADGHTSLIIDSGLAPPRFDKTPLLTNHTVDSRPRRAKVRRVPTTSTGENADGNTKQFNIHEYLPYG